MANTVVLNDGKGDWVSFKTERDGTTMHNSRGETVAMATAEGRQRIEALQAAGWLVE